MPSVRSLCERRRELEAAYPAVFALDGAALSAICSRYFDACPVPGRPGSGTDIVGFGAFLRDTLGDENSLPAYSGELVRFVHVLQKVRFAPNAGGVAPAASGHPTTLRDRPARAADVALERFSYNVTEIEAALREGREPDPREEEVHVVYGHRRDGGEPAVLQVSAAAAMLVELCDGSQTLGAVIAGATPSCLRPVMAPGALRAVDRLIDVGIFEMRTSAAALQPR